MASKVLVTYASRYGSTAEVAKVVAEELCGSGLVADIKPLREVRDLAAYRAVIVGAPLYFGALHKDVVEFVTQQSGVLRTVPAAFFALGPLHDDEGERTAARGALDALLAKVDGLEPVACEVFGGKLDPAQLQLGHRLIAALPASPLHGMPATDARDWVAIRTWARSLASLLAPAWA